MAVRKAKVDVDVNRVLGTINPNLYGAVWEWRDTICGGTWVGEDSSIPHIDGFRKDSIEALQKLSLPVLQWFPQAPFYHWEDGIGPKDKRPQKMLLPWGRVTGHGPMEVSHEIGTDEFIRFCRLIGAEPFLDTNESDPLGSRNWVEYCNYEGDTKYASLRAAHGHPEPHRVKSWHVYAWADLDPVAYAMDFRKFAAVARLVDPSIHIIASAAGGPEWVAKFFETLNRAQTPELGGVALVDHMAYIHYFGVLMKDIDFTNEDYYRLHRNIEGLDRKLHDHDVTLRFHSQQNRHWAATRLKEPYKSQVPQVDPIGMVISEWAVSFATRIVPLRDAIAGAGVLDTYHRWASRIHMAFLYMFKSLVQTDRGQLVLTPTYHLFDMYKAHRNNQSVAVDVQCDTIESGEEGGQRDFFGSLPVAPAPTLPILTSSASVRPDGTEVILSITNRHLTDHVEANITIEGAGKPASGTVTLLTSNDVRDYNGAEHPDRVAPVTDEYTPSDTAFSYTLPPHSITTIEIKT